MYYACNNCKIVHRKWHKTDALSVYSLCNFEGLPESCRHRRAPCAEEIMNLENRYLDALAKAVRYGFRAGNLAVTWRTNEVNHIMLLSPR